MAVGGIDTKLVPDADTPKGYKICSTFELYTFFKIFDSFRQSTILNVTLACDHRVIDGVVGAQWLQEFKQYLENPGSMIL